MKRMYRGSGPKIFPIIVVVIVIALLIAALVTVGRMLFAGNSTTQVPQVTSSIRNEVLDTGTTRGVRYTVRGPIVADEKFRSYQITVTPSSRVYVEYAGYLEREVRRETFANNMQAYEQFVYALDKADISVARDVTGGDDMRGVCATNGYLYVFETLAGNTASKTLWTSTCGGSPGSMGAPVARVHALFRNQIPDFTPIFDKTQ